MSRVVSGLTFARACARPPSIPLSRPRKKSKLAGLGYEKALAKALPQANHGQWFEFMDRNGRGHCQPDLILVEGGHFIVLEAKYTWTEAGHRQIEKLYKPVVEYAWHAPVFGVVVCKVLTASTPRGWVVSGLEEAKRRAKTGAPTVLHWLGTGLGPLQSAPSALPLAPMPAVL